MKRTLLAVTLGLWLLGGGAPGTQVVNAGGLITVTAVGDTIANDGFCTLREAIIAANSDAAYNGCPAGSGTDTILFDNALISPIVINLTQPGPDEEASLSGDLDITDDLILTGRGVLVTAVDGQSLDRVFDIQPGVTVTLTDITIQNGNGGSQPGGGIRNRGSLTLQNSALLNNTPSGLTNDGGLVTLNQVQVSGNTGGYGLENINIGTLNMEGGEIDQNSGGLLNQASIATLLGVQITQNLSRGGVVNRGTTSQARLKIEQAVIAENVTAVNGGGLFNEGNLATVTIRESQIRQNSAQGSAGGGIYNNGILTLQTSTVNGNQARTGGGIEHSGANLYLTNVTLSSNQASDDGGGLYNRGSAILSHVTFYQNQASGPATGGNIFNDEAQMAIDGSILQHAPGQANCFNSSGFLNSQGHNLESDASCEFDQPGDLSQTNPLLGMLLDNGGVTATHALSSGSPAVDAAGSSCPATDQRGVSRPQGAACDMGAFELEMAAQPDLRLTLTGDAGLVGTERPFQYQITVENVGLVTATQIQVTDTFSTELTFVGATTSGDGSCTFGTGVVCTQSALDPGELITVLVTVTTPSFEMDMVNQAVVSSAVADATPDNNSATLITAVSIIRAHFLPLLQK